MEHNGRNTDGTFKKGNRGKPKGALNNSTRLAMKLLQHNASEIVEILVDKALNGDMRAASLIFTRLTTDYRAINIDKKLPPLGSAKDTKLALDEVYQQLGSGLISHHEVKVTVDFITAYSKIATLAEFEERLVQLENAKHGP